MSESVDFRYDGSEIAVVGMSGRFPGAPDVDAFWRNLASGVESITRFSEEELAEAGEEAARLADPLYVRARPILDDVERFDAAFFGFSPREAEVLDPQLRLFLECAFSALEHAGYDPERLPGRASVFAGASFSNYLVHNLYQNRPVMEAFGDLQATIFNVQDSLVTMVGYKLNLKGACCAVQTFCSTSLVGVHLACQNLLNYESDLALAGGVTVYVPQKSGYLYEEGSIVSRDGCCRAFDARADGTVFGSGLGVVALRRLKDALEDGDTVHAVVRGSAVNNDGALKVSYAAPGVVGQTEVVVEALSAAGVDPETIGYVEAHGTATRLGDPAEVSALTKAFRTRTDRRAFCALGSVKTNVGHLDAAAGVAGLIKVVLSLQNGRIPPSLHCEIPNPAIDFAASPFFVNTKLREWPRLGAPRRAGVSAFGVGGTNAHVIVEEAPARRSEASPRTSQLLVLSAKTGTALASATARLAAHLEAHGELELADVAWTLQAGRSAFAHRRFVVASSPAEAATLLRSASGKEEAVRQGAVERKNPPIVLRLLTEEEVPVGAWRTLYEEEPTFREDFHRSVQATGDLGRAMQGALYPAAGLAPAPTFVERSLLPLATFALQHALAQLLRSLGIRFESVVGDGVGGIVAACLEHTMGFERAVRLAVRRGRPDAFPGEAPFEGLSADETLRAQKADPSRLCLQLGGGAMALAAWPDVPRAVGAASRAGVLACLGQLWQAGVDLDWRALHGSERRHRVPLPTYSFDRERFWVEPVPEAPKVEERNPSDWLFHPVWKRGLPVEGNAGLAPGNWLVFGGAQGFGLRLTERLRALGSQVVTVMPGPGFSRDGDAAYTLDPREAYQYSSLWQDLRARGQRPDRVLHLWSAEPLEPSVSDQERFAQASALGFYSLLHLAAARGEGPLAVTVVSTGLHEVIGGEVLAPEKAPLLGLCRVLGQEEEELRCVSIDIGPPAERDEALVTGLLAELGRAEPEPVVALRRGRRWVQDFERIPPSAHRGAGARLREGGVYLITGGLGDVGFALGALLAKGSRAKLAVTGRTGLPPRDRWDDWMDTHDAAEPTTVRIRKVRALEALGAEVLVLRADSANGDEMKAAVRATRERFSALHGVIHAAGEMSAETFRPARDLDQAACERQFAPKVHGLFALAEALRGEAPDMVLLISSLSSVLGGVGYGAYAGANAFLDAFAARENQGGDGVFVSIDWDQWEFAGREARGTARLAVREGAALRPAEGMAVFDAILRLRGMERVVVSTAPLLARMERWVVRPSAPAPRPAPGSARARPALGHPYVAPGTETERGLCLIWQELLGISEIGIHDDFFELGGHSLFAARVLSRVRAAFGVSLALEAVFDAPTVAGLARRVEGGRGVRAGNDVSVGERVEIEI